MTEQRQVEAQLDELMAAGCECEDLDFKATIDLTNRTEVVEFAKDVGAFLDKGGSIVIGADDVGCPSRGITEDTVALLDESRVRNKLARYLGGERETSRCASPSTGVVTASWLTC